MHYSNRQNGMQYDLNSNGYVNKPIRGEMVKVDLV